MVVTLKNGAQADITGVDLANGVVNFKWIDGEYSGDCGAPFAGDGFPTEAQAIEAIEGVFVG